MLLQRHSPKDTTFKYLTMFPIEMKGVIRPLRLEKVVFSIGQACPMPEK